MDSRSRSVAERSSKEEGASINRIQSIIMAMIIVISVGYIFIWIMISTNVYKQGWLPKIKAQTSTSTFFGTQGFDFNFSITQHDFLFFSSIFSFRFFNIHEFCRYEYVDLHISCSIHRRIELCIFAFRKEAEPSRYFTWVIN